MYRIFDMIILDLEIDSDKLCIDAVCINCNKRFTSMRAISMHLRMTTARHIVNFINYGNYNRKTGPLSPYAYLDESVYISAR